MSIRGLDVSATGLIAYSEQLGVISNNVSNINTNAFKRSEVRFQDVLYERFQTPGTISIGSDTGLGVLYGRGVGIANIPTVYEQGPFVPGFDLDVAINGEGFFRVQDADGEVFYTRLGNFQPKGIGAAGPLNIQVGSRIVTLDPEIVLPGNNAATTIDSFGVVRQGDFSAQISLSRIQNPDGLEQVGDLLFRESAASGEITTSEPGAPGFGQLIANSLEGSNVDVTRELISLISASQNFSLNSQGFVTGNEEIRQAIALVQQG